MIRSSPGNYHPKKYVGTCLHDNFCETVIHFKLCSVSYTERLGQNERPHEHLHYAVCIRGILDVNC
jgi:hypothetical protein